MVFRRSRWHHLCLGKHGCRHLLQPLYHLIGTQCSSLAVDDEGHHPTREHDGAVHLAQPRNTGQCIVCIVGRIELQEHRHVINDVSVFGARNDVFACHLHTVQPDGFWLQTNCSQFWLITDFVYGLVTDVRDTCENSGLFVWNCEIAAFIADTTTEQGGVGGIENSDVGVCHGLALFINDGACQATVSLVCTLHIDFSVI